MVRASPPSSADPTSRSAGDEQAAALHAAPASRLEWATGATGLVLVLAAVGYLIHAAIVGPEGPPQIRLAVSSVISSGAGYVVVVSAGNDGPTTAVDLEIEGSLRKNGAVVETSTARIDYLPRLSERSIGLFFSRDPADHRLDLRAVGYAEP